MATLTHNEMLAQPEIAKLMRWIDSHDRPALTLFDTETQMLTVSSVYVCNGVATVGTDVIPPSIQAARDLLGY